MPKWILISFFPEEMSYPTEICGVLLDRAVTASRPQAEPPAQKTGQPSRRKDTGFLWLRFPAQRFQGADAPAA